MQCVYEYTHMSALTTYKRQMAGRVVGESLEVAKLVSSKHQLVEARSQQQCKTTVAFDNTSHPSCCSYNCRFGRLNITPGPLIKKQLMVEKMRCRWKIPSWALSRCEHICRMHWTSFIWAEWWWERSIWRESMYRHSLERGGDGGRFIDRELHRCQYWSSHFPHGGNLLVLTQPLQWEIILALWMRNISFLGMRNISCSIESVRCQAGEILAPSSMCWNGKGTNTKGLCWSA